MKKIFVLLAFLLVTACQAGDFSPKRQGLYKNSGWDNIQNLTKR